MTYEIGYGNGTCGLSLIELSVFSGSAVLDFILGNSALCNPANALENETRIVLRLLAQPGPHRPDKHREFLVNSSRDLRVVRIEANRHDHSDGAAPTPTRCYAEASSAPHPRSVRHKTLFTPEEPAATSPWRRFTSTRCQLAPRSLSRLFTSIPNRDGSNFGRLTRGIDIVSFAKIRSVLLRSTS